MDYYRLKNFVTVAKEENITRAAIKMNMSQQALSSSIAVLEKELDVKLFDRIGRKIILNQSGRIVLRYASMLVEAHEKMIDELRAYNSTLNNALKIVSTSNYALQEITTEFMLRHKDIRILSHLIEKDDLFPLLSSDDTDFVISSMVIDNPQVQAYKLYEERIYAMVSIDHPLACHKTISLKDTEPYGYALTVPKRLFRCRFDEICKQVGIEPKIRLETDDETTLAFSIAKTQMIGFAVESASVNHVYQRSNIVRVLLTDEIAKREVYLLWKKRAAPSKYWNAFHSFVLNEFRHSVSEDNEYLIE